jgi:hypothetical protein
VVEAAALERVVDFAGAVRGDDHHRGLGGLDGAESGTVTWKSESTSRRKASKASSVTVELVDEEHGRARPAPDSRARRRGRFTR